MIHQIRTFTHVAWVIITCFTLTAIAQQASFQIVPTPGSFGANVQALAVPADVKVVTGEYFLFDQDPSASTVFQGCTLTFRWTAATGPQDIGVIVDKSQAIGNSISADRLQMVGQAYDFNSFQLTFIWTSSIRHQDLGTTVFPNDSSHSDSEAYGISAKEGAIRRTSYPDTVVLDTTGVPV